MAETRQTPLIETTGARFSIDMVSALSAQGLLRFMTFERRMNAERFIEFLQRLIYRATTRIFLVLDGHPVHKSKRVNAFVASTNARLRLFILPPYSPHLNPDEWVWNWLKRHKVGKARITSPDQFRALINRYLRSLQKLPALIRRFFADPNPAYII